MSMQNEGGGTGVDARRLLASLPAVSRLLDDPAVAPLIEAYGNGLVTDLLREHLDGLRAAILGGESGGAALEQAVTVPSIVDAVTRDAEALLLPRPRTVINATGIVVHTNLGRATLSKAAADALAATAHAYQDLEYDVDAGKRGNRLAHLEPPMRRLFPGYGFTVVNNNAAAIMLCLRALSRGKRVLVSRGELVEIGGSFRIPDIMNASGAELHEVGTTNRTRPSDYADAVGPETGMLLKVHTSNFKVVGFTEETSVAQLAELARGAGLPLVVDWGSGDLVDLEPLSIADEMPVIEILKAGADLVTFSGDKLLGGPQAGFVVGRPELIARVKKDPLARVCRLDRLRLGALNATLGAYVRGKAFEEVPTLRMLAATAEQLGTRAAALKAELERRAEGATFELVDGISKTGGGSSPTGERPTRLLAVAVGGGDAGGLEQRLRAGEPPVIGRVQEGRLLLDLRTVLPEQEPALVERLVEALARR